MSGEQGVVCSLTPGEKNIIHKLSVDAEKTTLPHCHIKLVVMKQNVKALDHNGDCFRYICQVSMTKRKRLEFLNGPQIRQLLRDPKFAACLLYTSDAADD